MAVRPARPPLARNVKVLAAVSFLNDVASEVIYPLLPLFLTSVIGVSAAVLGAIEGLSESVSSLLRLPAGWWSDRVKRRKPLVALGYGVAAFVRPLIGVATGVGQVIAIRLADRFGKGIRSAPRDALIADSVPQAARGYAYGVHRGADNFGAVLGPLVAWAALTFASVDLRTLFLWTAVPGVLAFVLLLALVREVPPAVAGARVTERTAAATGSAHQPTPGAAGATLPLGAPFWRYLAVVLLFTLSLSSDAFILLRATQLGVTTAMIPVLWATLHVVKSGTSVLGGVLSDRIGRRPLILGGWAIYALVYVGFALADASWQLWALFVVYGLYFGMTEGVEKALVADLVPEARRGAAFGWFNAATGIAALPASLVFGVIWEWVGAAAAFMTGAVIAALAAVLFAALVPARPAPRRQQR